MRYHLDTIPVWDAFKQDEYCPFCYLFRKREALQVDRCLGGAVMEPDTRIRMNERGFCPEHHKQLYALQNRLGHALLMESHLKTLTEKAGRILEQAASRPKAGLFRKESGESTGKALRALTSSCLVCENLENDMAQYAYTAAVLYEKESEFPRALEKAPLCMTHIALMADAAEKHASDGTRKKIYASLLTALKRDGEKCITDIGAFARSFDYRNADLRDIPRNALEQAVNFSRERCLGGDPAKEKPQRK